MPFSNTWHSLKKHSLPERFQPDTPGSLQRTAWGQSWHSPAPILPDLSPAFCFLRCCHSLPRSRASVIACLGSSMSWPHAPVEGLLWAGHQAVQSAALPWGRAMEKFCKIAFQGSFLIFVFPRLKTQAVSTAPLCKVFQKHWQSTWYNCCNNEVLHWGSLWIITSN